MATQTNSNSFNNNNNSSDSSATTTTTTTTTTVVIDRYQLTTEWVRNWQISSSNWSIIIVVVVVVVLMLPDMKSPRLQPWSSNDPSTSILKRGLNSFLHIYLSIYLCNTRTKLRTIVRLLIAYVWYMQQQHRSYLRFDRQPTAIFAYVRHLSLRRGKDRPIKQLWNKCTHKIRTRISFQSRVFCSIGKTPFDAIVAYVRTRTPHCVEKWSRRSDKNETRRKLTYKYSWTITVLGK